MKNNWIKFSFLLVLALGSCGPVIPPPAAPSTLEGSTPMPRPTSAPLPGPAELADLVQKATEDLSKMLSVPAGQIKLVNASKVVWPDGSLGCPQKDMAYTGVLTPGYLVVLETGGMQYEYHSGRDGSLTYCKNPAAPANGVSGDV